MISKDLKREVEEHLIVNIPYFYKGIKIQPLSVKEIFALGENNYKKILSSVLYTPSYLYKSKILLTDCCTILEVLSEIPYLWELVYQMLQLTTGINNISIIDNIDGKVICFDDIELNSDEYEELCNIIAIQYNSKLLYADDVPKVVKEIVVADDRFKEFQDRINETLNEEKKYREKHNEDEKDKRKNSIFNVFRFVSIHQSNFDYEILSSKNVYQLMDIYYMLRLKQENEYTMNLITKPFIDTSKIQVKDLYTEIVK